MDIERKINKTVEVMPETTLHPITLMGKMAGICYGTPTWDDNLNNVRGMNCLRDGHMRVAEYPQIYLKINGYSAAVIREFYTHIGGSPTRLQNSTRYINYAKNGFDMVYPPYFNDEQLKIWKEYSEYCLEMMNKLNDIGVAKEDFTKLMPLASQTNIVVRMNLRELIHMCHERMCSRAYWEFRQLMYDIVQALINYGNEYEILKSSNFFSPKCKFNGYCSESKSCGRKMPKAKALEILEEAERQAKL